LGAPITQPVKAGGRCGERADFNEAGHTHTSTEAGAQFLVVLSGTDPLVWRRNQVPERYSFWDLLVAGSDGAR
jgi:hypothetical protein